MSLDEIKKRYKQFINIESPERWYKFSLLSLNRLVGGKGVRGGRILQLLGDKSSGKTTLALDLARDTQKQEEIAAIIDFERTYDPDYAEFLGVDTESLVLVKPDTAETGLAIAEELIDSGVMLVIIDSIAAPITNSEREKDLNDSEKMAASAGLITRFLKRMIPKLDNTGALLVLINQNRANISTMSRKEKKPFGALAIQYLSSTTLELARIKNGENESIVQVFVEKNKQGGIERLKAEITLAYGKGFDVFGDILLLALEQEIITKRGAWFYYGDMKAQGMEQAKLLFPIEEIRDRVMNTNTGLTQKLGAENELE
jgi:recombination protein RecA